MASVDDYLSRHPEHADVEGRLTLAEHDLTIARIQDEKAARLALEEQRQQLQKRKEALIKETTAKKEELGKLDAEVEKWLGGQEGVRKVFGAREKKLGQGGVS